MKCPVQSEIVAYLQGELDKKSRVNFDRHLAACPDCSRLLSDYRRILQRLKDIQDDQPVCHMSGKVLEAINSRSAVRLIRFFRWATAAGLLISVIFGGWLWSRQGGISRPPQDETVNRALVWLVKTQDVSGKWSVEKWNGRKEFEVALTGFAIMALNGRRANRPAEYLPHIQKAADYLASQQVQDGRFGPSFSSALYNHSIATFALMEWYGLSKDEKLSRPLKHALDYLKLTQSPLGGWGYLGSPNEPPNTAVSFWALQSLLLAEALGFEDVKPSIQKGFRWLASVSDDEGRPGYQRVADFPYGRETLSAMAAFCYTYGGAKYLAEPERYQKLFDEVSKESAKVDKVNYYQFYFLSYLEHPDLTQGKQNLVKTLIQQQSIKNDLKGSWDLVDPWSEVGGRVYTTALATLSLETSTRVARLKNWFSQVD